MQMLAILLAALVLLSANTLIPDNTKSWRLPPLAYWAQDIQDLWQNLGRSGRGWPTYNLVYYGSMADEYIVMLQVLESKKLDDLELATKVSVQLQRTDPAVKARDRVVKKSEKDGFYTALDVGCVWLERALNSAK